MMQFSTAEIFGRMTGIQLAWMYRDYKNNFITLKTWAEHYSIPDQDIPFVLMVCKSCHEAGF